MIRFFSPILFLLLLCPLAISAQKPKTTNDVAIQDRRFNPARITIKAGQSVTWTNNDNLDHTVEAKDSSFSSGTIKRGKTYDHTFSKPGEYPYECRLHPRMKGVVVVTK